ncbi:glycosyltransferase family 39 protein [Actinosynnema sp. ALI-1.44]|uniref:glycosyltransferase family 39 protein n=1 Tax=Actinosynnema sp. ALI-1.44 TaxID=1933779 RepID=UPI00143DA0CA|nr:glycosyltransferase family 39 protein [Actinosynnema sp. ALI-1.44]
MLAVVILVWAVLTVGLVVGWSSFERNPRLRTLALGAILALALAHMLMYSVVAEDAYISLRYSAQLADGNGMVFNVGEKVEGYSNFLWVILVALPKVIVPGIDIVAVAAVLGVLCALAAVFVAYVLVRRVSGSASAGLLAGTVIAASGSFAGYGPSGLETPLFVLLVLLVLLMVWTKRPLWAGVLIALATMTRPDGALLAALLGVWLIWRAIRGRDTWRAALLYLAGAFVLAVPWTIWRVVYYGHLLPNAMAAKSGVGFDVLFASGWDYLLGFVGATQALLLLIPVALYELATRRNTEHDEARAVIWLVFGLAGAYIAFFVLAGGDWMPGFRFFASAIPLLAVGIAASWALSRATTSEWERGGLPKAGAVVAVSLALLSIAVSATHPKMRPAFLAWDKTIKQLADTGAWLGRSLPPGAVMSTFANGALTFEAGNDRMVVDQLGLTDEHIARKGKRNPEGLVGHQAYDDDYMVNVRKPDVMVTDGRGFLKAMVCAPAEVFAKDYQLANFQVDDQWAFVYLRREKAPQLLEALTKDPRFVYVPC